MSVISIYLQALFLQLRAMQEKWLAVLGSTKSVHVAPIYPTPKWFWFWFCEVAAVKWLTLGRSLGSPPGMRQFVCYLLLLGHLWVGGNILPCNNAGSCEASLAFWVVVQILLSPSVAGLLLKESSIIPFRVC